MKRYIDHIFLSEFLGNQFITAHVGLGSLVYSELFIGPAV